VGGDVVDWTSRVCDLAPFPFRAPCISGPPLEPVKPEPRAADLTLFRLCFLFGAKKKNQNNDPTQRLTRWGGADHLSQRPLPLPETRWQEVTTFVRCCSLWCTKDVDVSYIVPKRGDDLSYIRLGTSSIAIPIPARKTMKWGYTPGYWVRSDPLFVRLSAMRYASAPRNSPTSESHRCNRKIWFSLVAAPEGAAFYTSVRICIYGVSVAGWPVRRNEKDSGTRMHVVCRVFDFVFSFLFPLPSFLPLFLHLAAEYALLPRLGRPVADICLGLGTTSNFAFSLCRAEGLASWTRGVGARRWPPDDHTW
jgi:hypothetical protein